MRAAPLDAPAAEDAATASPGRLVFQRAGPRCLQEWTLEPIRERLA